MQKYIKPTAVGIILAVGFGLIWFLAVRSGGMTAGQWEIIKRRIKNNAKKQTMGDIIRDLNSVLS